MESEIFKIVGAVAGIGGLALGVFFFVFRDVVRKNIFPMLRPDDAAHIIGRIVLFTFLISVLGILTWGFIEIHGSINGSTSLPSNLRLGYTSPPLFPIHRPTDQEIRANARKELQNMGIVWSCENFKKAIREQEAQTVTLFLESGIQVSCSPNWQSDR